MLFRSNRWGDLAKARPRDVLVVRYEDLQADTRDCLQRVATHLRLPMDDADHAVAMDVAAREAVRARLDPEDADAIMPSDAAKAVVRFSADDRSFMAWVFRRHLRHDFGYGYREPPRDVR